jgi:hypothetical protein
MASGGGDDGDRDSIDGPGPEPGGANDPGPEPGESPKERVDRELVELLNELRVALSGTTVLFAFLLTLPFSQLFAELTALQESVYFGTFLAAAITTALLMAPTSYHRLKFREGDKEQMLFLANKLAIAGIGTLTLTVGGSVFLVADLLYGSRIAALVAGAMTLFVIVWWFIVPLTRKLASR